MTAKSYTAKLSTSWTGTAKFDANCNGAVNLNVLNEGSNADLDTNGKSAHYGDTITVGFDTTVNNYAVYKLEVVGNVTGKKVDVSGTSRTGVFTFVMPAEDVTLTATYAADTFEVNFVGKDAMDINAGEATPGQQYRFTATPKAGYELKSITYAGNGKTGTLTSSPYTIGADAVAKGLTVTFNTALKEFNVNVVRNSGAPTISGVNSYDKQTVKTSITFTVDAEPQYFTVNVDDVGGKYSITRTGDLKTLVTVYDMTQAGSIVISAK